MIEIEKGIPIPPARQPGVKAKSPRHEMEVGDSYFVKTSARDACVVEGNKARCWGRKNGGKKFSTRQVEGGVRIWRVA